MKRLLIVTPVAAALASCSVTSGIGEIPAPSPETVTVTQPVTEAAPQPAPPRDCATLPKDPRQQYATGTAPGRMPAVDYADYNYWIADIDNAYDPCAHISWIVFEGSLGDPEKPAGTAGSITDGIAFYIDGVPDGEMRTFVDIETVELLADDVVRLSWGTRTRSTAEGITAHYTVDLTTDNGRIVPLSGNVAEFEEQWNAVWAMYQLGTFD